MKNVLRTIDYKEYGMLYALIIFWILMFFTNQYFRSWENILSIMREASFYGITVLGMTFLIGAKMIDLSVGPAVALIGIICISLLDVVGIYLSIIICLIIGAFIGLVNGFLTVKLNIPSIIVTLGTFNIIKSVSYIITGGPPITTKNSVFTNIGNGSFLSIPIPFYVYFAFTLVAIYLMTRTKFGRYTLAVGNNEKAAYIAGVKTQRVRISVFILLGIFTAISAILLSSRLWSSNADLKPNYEFDVITITVMSGCLLSGGKANILNTFFSTLFYVSIANAMNNYHVDPFWQYVIKGFILLLAFSINSIREIIIDKIQLQKIRSEQQKKINISGLKDYEGTVQ